MKNNTNFNCFVLLRIEWFLLDFIGENWNSAQINLISKREYPKGGQNWCSTVQADLLRFSLNHNRAKPDQIAPI